MASGALAKGSNGRFRQFITMAISTGPVTGGGVVHCQEAATGKEVYAERLKRPRAKSGPRRSSPTANSIRLKGERHLCRGGATEVQQLAHNVIEGDMSRSNASLAVSDGQLFPAQRSISVTALANA